MSDIEKVSKVITNPDEFEGEFDTLPAGIEWKWNVEDFDRAFPDKREAFLAGLNWGAVANSVRAGSLMPHDPVMHVGLEAEWLDAQDRVRAARAEAREARNV